MASYKKKPSVNSKKNENAKPEKKNSFEDKLYPSLTPRLEIPFHVTHTSTRARQEAKAPSLY